MTSYTIGSLFSGYGGLDMGVQMAFGMPAPAPTIPGRTGRRLSPAFVEWMMGLPTGHVTSPEIGLSRVQQLRALGNGVVPQQAKAALRIMASHYRQAEWGYVV